MRLTKLVVGVMIGASLVACRGNEKPDPQVTPDAAPAPQIRIQDVQSDSMAVGTAVELRGVIVTAIDGFGDRRGGMWVQDPAGGQRSGVAVFRAPLDQVALAPGDIIDITGATKTEFTINGDNSGRSVTQIQPPRGGQMMITKTGTGTVPAPAVVDALAIGMKATQRERDDEWEKWEGVLVTVNNVSALNQPVCITSQGNCEDDSFQRFSVTGDLVVQSALSAMPAGVVAEACLASVTGVVDYAFNYVLYPIEAEDTVLGGTACPAKETACADSIDNDGNRFKDCDDNACVVASAACRSARTIADIQAAVPTTPIELKDVFVTALARDKKSLWVASSLTAQENGGVFVFRSDSAPDLDPAIVRGAKVTVIGRVSEFNDDGMGAAITQVSPLSIAVVEAPADALVPAEQTVAALLVPATAPKFESVLVKLSNVTLTEIGTAMTGDIAKARQGTSSFQVSTQVVSLTQAELGCYPSVVGLWTSLQAPGAATKPNAFGFIPVELGEKSPDPCP